jgi:hypothetical protein
MRQAPDGRDGRASLRFPVRRGVAGRPGPGDNAGDALSYPTGFPVNGVPSTIADLADPVIG